MAKGSKKVAGKRESVKAMTSKAKDSDVPTTAQIPEALQQHILNIFRDAFFDDPEWNLEEAIQEVKQHLYDRDFAAAFGSDQNLQAYAARWSPSRALCYAQILQDISPFLTEQPDDSTSLQQSFSQNVPRDPSPFLEQSKAGAPPRVTSEDSQQPTTRKPRLEQVSTAQEAPPGYEDDISVPSYEHPPTYGANMETAFHDAKTTAQGQRPAFQIACLGGGAGAELVASAAWLRMQNETIADEPDAPFDPSSIDTNSLEVDCVDSGSWAFVLQKLSRAIENPPSISQYASAAAKAANVEMLPSEAMRSIFIQQDLLDSQLDDLRRVFGSSNVITIMFTLNELYSVSVSKTQRLLFELTVATNPGTLLLVVDSPGSYSTVKLNNTEKNYPMYWLLDHTLLEASKNTRFLPRADHWQKLLTDDSRWFRLPKGLQYPIELENMRYQIHLYRRLAVPDDHSVPGPSGGRAAK